ncbi:MAG: epoxyqueuosine reductase QueH [Candidatus Cryptobacteroides sp.]
MKNGERQSVRTLPETCNDRNEVIWWDRNWRKNGLQDRRNALLKQYNFYNQLYCGCEYSMRSACDSEKLASGRKVE